MASNIYNVGDLPRLEAQFKNINGEDQDPSTVTFKVKKPNGTVVSKLYGVDAEVVRTDTGRYHLDYSIDIKGFHRWWAIGTGLVQAVEQLTFIAYPGAP